MTPEMPTAEMSVQTLQRMHHAARRILLILEGKAKRRLAVDEAYNAWCDHREALAVIGFKIAVALRARGQKVPLSFFSVRMPKQEFDVPLWMKEPQ